MDQLFENQKKDNVKKAGLDGEVRDLSLKWQIAVAKYQYCYNFTWLGLPIIQFPQDIVVMQEIIWKVKPDLIIETGIARGGSLIFYASILTLLGGTGKVLGIDIDIRDHNRQQIEEHPLSNRIVMLQGSSVEGSIVEQVYRFANDYKIILVLLDSNHTHQHVLSELQSYSPLVKKGSYLVVCDTGVEEAPEHLFEGRPWKKGNSPKSAAVEFLKTSDRFVIDKDINSKLLISSSIDGYLKCIKD